MKKIYPILLASLLMVLASCDMLYEQTAAFRAEEAASEAVLEELIIQSFFNTDGSEVDDADVFPVVDANGIPTTYDVTGVISGSTITCYLPPAQWDDRATIFANTVIVPTVSDGAKVTWKDETETFEKDEEKPLTGNTTFDLASDDRVIFVTSEDESTVTEYTVTLALFTPQPLTQVVLTNYNGATGVNLTIDDTDATQLAAEVGFNTTMDIKGNYSGGDSDWSDSYVTTTTFQNVVDGDAITVAGLVVEGLSHTLQLYLDIDGGGDVDTNDIDWDTEYFFNKPITVSGAVIGDNRMTVDVNGGSVSFGAAE
jgi:hypothetical protein